MSNDLTLADIAAVTNRNNGNNSAWGGESLITIVVLFLFFAMFRNGGFGNMFGNDGVSGDGVNYLQPALTRGELCQDMNFQDVKNAVRFIIIISLIALNCNSINLFQICK